MKRVFQVLNIILFVSLIFAVPIFSKVLDKEHFLFYENRNVNYIEDFTKERFLDGSYFESVEKYFTDIFPFREDILKFHTYIDRSVLKKPVVNDIVFSGDFLLAKVNYAKCNEEQIKKDSKIMAARLASLNRFINSQGGKFYYVFVNEQYSYFRDKYPEYIFNNDEVLNKTNYYFLKELNSKNINFIDMGEVFYKLGKKDLFYSKIDHHYSYEGAFITYKTIIDKINSETDFNVPKLNEEDFNFEYVKNTYIGSRNRKLMGVYDFTEKLKIGYPKTYISFERWDNGNKSESKLFYTPPYMDENVTYLAYMGGDIGETVIKTNRENLLNVLVVGDSFTNPLETIIYTSFNEMHSIDLRKYDKMTIRDYIRNYKPDIVLMIRDDISCLDFEGNGYVY